MKFQLTPRIPHDGELSKVLNYFLLVIWIILMPLLILNWLFEQSVLEIDQSSILGRIVLNGLEMVAFYTLVLIIFIMLLGFGEKTWKIRFWHISSYLTTIFFYIFFGSGIFLARA